MEEIFTQNKKHTPYMKIGILTLPPRSNYGGILQAYALQTALEQLGHEAKIIDARRQDYSPHFYRLPLKYARRLVWKLTDKESDFPFFFERYAKDIDNHINKFTDKFVDKYLHRLPTANFRDLNEKDFDAIVVGSDQVWRPLFFPFHNGITIADAYLSFAKRWPIKRIAYAASFGTDQWEYSWWQTLRCRPLAKLFDAISLREASGIGLVKEHFGVEAVHMIDPTMLLFREDYSKLVDNAEASGLIKQCQHKPFLLNYTLDESEYKQAIVNDIAENKGLEQRKVASKGMDIRTFSWKDMESYQLQPVESWLRNFRDCDYVVTDSFHGTVFSIINQKQFIVIGNKGRGMARFESLLDLFGLKSRLISCDMDYRDLLSSPIDYMSVNEKLNGLRTKSLDFLRKYL